MNGNKLPIVYELLKRNTFGLYFILKDFISRNVSLQILRMKLGSLSLLTRIKPTVEVLICLKFWTRMKTQYLLHIRRGDYLQPKHWATTGSVCQLPYYQNAIAEMSRRVASPSYYIFSDDIAWVKENLPLQNAVYIDWNTDEDSWQDMMLMSHCKHHIICNSTFSWWGAWLNPNMDKTVIVPSRWFQHSEAPDIYPTGWIKVPVS